MNNITFTSSNQILTKPVESISTIANSKLGDYFSEFTNIPQQKTVNNIILEYFSPFEPINSAIQTIASSKTIVKPGFHINYFG